MERQPIHGGLKHGTKQRIPRRKNAACMGSGATYVRPRTRASCLRYRRIPPPPPWNSPIFTRVAENISGNWPGNDRGKAGGVSRMIRRESIDEESLRGSKRHFSPPTYYYYYHYTRSSYLSSLPPLSIHCLRSTREDSNFYDKVSNLSGRIACGKGRRRTERNGGAVLCTLISI